MAIPALKNMKLIRSIDISAAFLQAEKLEGEIWRLRKPLYGLNDAGRRFWLKVKKILEENGYRKLEGDEAFHYKNEKEELKGMILLHVDDFLMAGDDDFLNETTEMFEKNLSVSKKEDDEF